MLTLTKQIGAAIIVALFFTSLVAVAAIMMIERLHINLHSTELITHNLQANLLARGSVAWAIEQLNTDWRQKKPNQLIDFTPIKSPVNQVENANISSVIFDTQGRFNLNNLSNPAAQTDFIRLINTVYPKISTTEARNITLAIVNWISAGAINNMLDDYYAKQTPPYRAPHRLMVSVSELRLVKGVTADLYTALAPYIIALPEATSININNAAVPVLMSLSPTLTLTAAKAIYAKAKQAPFPSVQVFQQFDVVKNNPVPDNKITVESSYFLVKSSVTVGQQKTMLYTLLQRTVKDQKPTEVILWQSKGTL
jgi:general secretion pathway protein K